MSIENENITQKAVRGGIWLIALKAIAQGLVFLRLIILAQLLTPVDFGILGISWMVITTFEAFSQTGISVAIIQHKGQVDQFFNEAWSFLLLRGIVLFSIVLIIAPYVSDFFLNNSDAVGVIRWMGVLFLLNGISSIGLIHIQKEMQFEKFFVHQFAVTLADFIISIIIAYIFRNVWALVAGIIAGGCVGCVVSYLIHPFRPAFAFCFNKIKGLLNFGKWNTGSSICIFLGSNMDSIFIGRMLGPASLGLYQMAFKISNLPAAEISNLFSRVAFPAYSKLQDRKEDLKIAFYKVLKMIQFITIPIGFCIVAMSYEFVNVFMGEKWLPMVPAMKLLAVGGVLKSIVSTGSGLFIGSGRPEKDFYMQLIRALTLAATLYIFIHFYGIIGASIGFVVSIMVMWIFWYIFLTGMISSNMAEYLGTIYPPFIASTIMMMIIVGIKRYLIFTPDAMLWSIMSFAGIALMSILCYFSSLLLLRIITGNKSSIEDLRMIRKMIKK